MARQIGDAAHEEYRVMPAGQTTAIVHGLIWRYRNVIACLWWTLGGSGLTDLDFANADQGFWTMVERMQTYMRLAGG